MPSDQPISTPPVEPKAKPARTRKAKSTVTPTGKRSLNLSIPIEDHERLAIHAMRSNMTISDLVCKLAREHCREWHLTRTPSRSGADGGQEG